MDDHDHSDAQTAAAEPRALGAFTTVLVSRRESLYPARQLGAANLSEVENRRGFGKCSGLRGHDYETDKN